MRRSGKKGAGFGFALAGALLCALPAGAQVAPPAAESADAALSRNLRLLAQNPNSVSALMSAGRAALELGDPEAAITFFARAETQTPSDGRIKMWIGAAMVQLQQPRAALRFFKEATDLGMPEADVARERGLAYDILGDPRSAQRDYRLVLQRGRDPEATRRLALSLAISGQREPALKLLEEQLLVGDRGAERARAMILALTGDVAGADRAVRSSMPEAQANAMSPFLSRLRGLSLADRALAVHLGVFPGPGSGGSGTAYAANDFASAVASATEAGRPDDSRASLGRRTAEPQPVTLEPRRRPGSETAVAARTPAPIRPATVATAEKPPTMVPGPSSEAPVQSKPAVVRTADARARKGTVASRSDWYWSRGGMSTTTRQEKPKPKPAEPQPAKVQPQSEAESAPPAIREAEAEPVPAAGEPLPPEIQGPAPVEIAASEVAASGPPAAVIAAPADAIAPADTRLADLAATLSSVEEKEPAPRPKLAAAPKRAPTPATKSSTPAKKAAPPAEPSRIWVQIAGGADKSALPREFARLKAKAPKAFGTHAAFTAPLNATNRLLVGPFPSAQAAQAFINTLKAASLSGFAWTSTAGQKIDKLPAK